ncbi:hypothetical protein [Guyparkeria sp. SCN-R1]|uniref:hypothetical protein n=1 Tax=Guyparkeria sp. SCN-R1 TaxID=2341113 RepID=UPI000F64E929|nr:hypothetical protein [Guyparkeria sp. SCN-R1]
MAHALVVKAGDYVSHAHSGESFQVKGFEFWGVVGVKPSAHRSLGVPIDEIVDSEGRSLAPGFNYLMYAKRVSGSSYLVLDKDSQRDDWDIGLKGLGDARIGRNRLMRDYRKTLYRETSHVFGDRPPEVVISVGDEVRMRRDVSSYDGQDGGGVIEMVGRKGVVEEVSTGRITLKVDFSGRVKEYQVYRFADKTGSVLERGWHYECDIEDGVFGAKPVRKNYDLRISVTGNFRGRNVFGI